MDYVFDFRPLGGSVVSQMLEFLEVIRSDFFKQCLVEGSEPRHNLVQAKHGVERNRKASIEVNSHANEVLPKPPFFPFVSLLY